MDLTLSADGLAAPLEIEAYAISDAALFLSVPFTLRRRGVEMKIVAGDPEPMPDPVLVKTLANAHRWAEALRTGASIAELARREKVSESFLPPRIRLAFLSPRLQQAILSGDHPPGLTAQALIKGRIPLCWEKQEQMFLERESKRAP